MAAASSVAAIVVAGMCGCASPPPPPAPTTLALTFEAAPGMNAGPGGRAEPLMVRVYQLAATNGFANADFFQLFGNDARTLGPDLVHRDDLVLVPGHAQTLTLVLPDAVHEAGIFAGLRDPASGTWRLVIPAAPHRATTVTVTVAAHGLARNAPATPPPPGHA